MLYGSTYQSSYSDGEYFNTVGDLVKFNPTFVDVKEAGSAVEWYLDTGPVIQISNYATALSRISAIDGGYVHHIISYYSEDRKHFRVYFTIPSDLSYNLGTLKLHITYRTGYGRIIYGNTNNENSLLGTVELTDNGGVFTTGIFDLPDALIVGKSQIVLICTYIGENIVFDIDNLYLSYNEYIPPPPSAPILSATGGVGVNRIALSWSNVGAYTYKVYKYNSNLGTWGLFQTLSGTSLNDYNVSQEIFYFYYVVAVSNIGTPSGPSNVASAKISKAGILMPGQSRATIYQGIQIGFETTPGITVPATKRLLNIDMNQVPMVPTKVVNTQAGRGGVGTQKGQRWTECKFSGAMDFNILNYLFSLCYGVKTPVLANLGYTRVWNPNSGSEPEVPASATLEQGSTKGAEKFGYATVQDIQFKWSEEDATVEGTIFGQKQARNITMTQQIRMNTGAAALSATSLTVTTPGVSTGTIPNGTYKTNLGKVFVVTGGGTITAGSATLTVTALAAAITAGEVAFSIPEVPAVPVDSTGIGIYYAYDGVNYTQLLDTIDGQINLNGMWAPSNHVNDTLDTFDRLKELDPNITGTITTEEGTEADNRMNDLDNGNIVYIKLQARGLQINASPLVRYLLMLEVPFYVTKPDPGDKSDVYGNTFSLENAHDLAFGLFRATIITTLPTL